MSGPIGVPQPVVGVERVPLIAVHLVVGRAEISSLLADAHWALEAAVERGVEHRLVVFGSSIHLDAAQFLVPQVAAILHNLLQRLPGHLGLIVGTSLVDTDIGHGISHDHCLSACKAQRQCSVFAL